MNKKTDRLTPAQSARISRKLNLAWHMLSEVYGELDKLGFHDDASRTLEARGKVTMIRSASLMERSDYADAIKEVRS